MARHLTYICDACGAEFNSAELKVRHVNKDCPLNPNSKYRKDLAKRKGKKK